MQTLFYEHKKKADQETLSSWIIHISSIPNLLFLQHLIITFRPLFWPKHC